MTILRPVRVGVFGVSALVVALLASGCGKRSEGAPNPGPSVSATASTGALSVPELKLHVLDALGGSLDYCDPDSYPIATATSRWKLARRALPRMRSDRDAWSAILEYEQADGRHLARPQLVRAYGVYKEMAFIRVRRSGDVYAVRVYEQDATVFGSITSSGVFTEDRREPNTYGCPICLARSTRIATPHGAVAVHRLRVGDTVWSTGPSGHRIAVRVVAVGRTPVPPTHQLVDLRLADGREVRASPGHPTPTGSTVGALRPGGRFEGTRIASAKRVAYSSAYTYDILPGGPTGTYFANSVLLASTLSP